AMADPLITTLNDLAMAELDIDVIRILENDLGKYAAHFQNTADFMAILAEHWPAYLREKDRIEPMARRVKLLRAAANTWQETPPDFPVIVAGSTGTLPATAAFIKTVSRLPKGRVVLPGLDQHIDDQAWQRIDEQHPQGALKHLLAVLELERKDIPVWPGIQTAAVRRMRERILAESLIPAQSTSDWPTRIAMVKKDISGANTIEDGLAGLSLIEAANEDEEAGVIALLMRHALEHKKTCALVTPDPALARRVRAKLSRYDLNVDSSAGEPLEETSMGAFLSLVLDAAADPFDPVAMSTLFLHPFYHKTSSQRQDWLSFEAKALRGPRARSLAQLKSRFRGGSHPGLQLFEHLQQRLNPLSELYHKGQQSAKAWARIHVQTLEGLSAGPEPLWRGEAGEKAAQMFENLLSFGAILPDMHGPAYRRLISNLMRGQVVRPRYGTEEKLQILGPLEARMIEADTLILGGLNEGVWPAHPAPHPLLSRGMRKKIGLSAPEQRFGLSAHDFAVLAAKPQVFLTRAKRSMDGPTVMSRWLWRLKTLVKGALSDTKILDPDLPYLTWARHLDRAPDTPALSPRPAPAPPVDKRWPMGRKLSVTQFSKWIRDPYSIYASKILGLEPLDIPDTELSGREYGIAIHEALEIYAKENSGGADRLFALMMRALERTGYEPHTLVKQTPRLRDMANWCDQWMCERAASGWQLSTAEKRGQSYIADVDFTISGVADRIEKRGQSFAVIDYKTGSAAGKKEVAAGFEPQLPLLAYMLEHGAFGEGGAAEDLLYILPRAVNENTRVRSLCHGRDAICAPDLVQNTMADITNLIKSYDQETTAYYSQPRAKYINIYGDYDHLARREEWAVLGQDNPGDGHG
ncbi:MAG TPA: double-strand break repair protein AddB, partial [Hellea balneolensis]|nr:double-strand break repair protein AddB [Hellea balneolensis]